MKATREELQKWLDQFPAKAEIEVITTEDSTHGYESYTSVYQSDLDLTETVSPDGNTYGKTFEIERDWKSGEVTLIRLGVKN